MVKRSLFLILAILLGSSTPLAVRTEAAETPLDFNRDIRPILSNNCFTCHGPDTSERQAGLRLDLRDGAVAELDSGERAVVPGHPEQSGLIARVQAEDESLRMPPAESGKRLTEREVALLTRWIRQGADFARHWSYVPPVRPELPQVTAADWPRNPVDHFILARLEREGLGPSPQADRYALARRVSLDLTGLPPTVEEVERFVKDPDPRAYEHLVDRLLEKETYGEHWARMWLDLARYADSAGYADDPPRTIWAYRDYVIRSLNANKPFDQFTLEQIAGDLLPDPRPEQLTATAFHRNTLTNNEGGTNDEEFRNEAIVDRVNTTMAVWMGTTVGCAQCHNHKYDPISQEEFFRLFAIFNNTSDADRRDESPLLEIWTEEQQRQKAQWQTEIEQLERTLATVTPELVERQRVWEQKFSVAPRWHLPRPAAVELAQGEGAQGEGVMIREDASVLVPRSQPTNRYTLTIPLGEPAPAESLTALRLEALPDASLPGQGPGHAGGNFVVTRVLAQLQPPDGQSPEGQSPGSSAIKGRYVRIELPGKQKILSLAEVQVLSGQENVALQGEATQSSTAYDGPPQLAIDGNTDGVFDKRSTTHTATEENPWWEVDLKGERPIDQLRIWNRVDNGLHTRLKDFRIAVLDERRQVVWDLAVAESPQPSGEYSLSGARPIEWVAAFADYAQEGFPASATIDGPDPDKTGWAVGPQFGQPRQLTLVARAPVELPAGSRLTVTIEQQSTHAGHTLGHFRLSWTGDPRISELADTPQAIVDLLQIPAEQRSVEQARRLQQHYLAIAPELETQRKRLAEVKKLLADARPATTVPIMRELAENARRETRIQRRGNFLELGNPVSAGVPAAFHSLPGEEQSVPGGEGASGATGEGPRTPNRLDLAHWLVDERNPLTARVIVNRYWEAVFGRGLVVTSEEFGSQGELPTHPQLLDWLAVELVSSGWDLKQLLRTLVTSATYRQSSAVTPELLERDSDNQLLARGPRFRLAAETIRDQALFVSGLLSPKMYGPPVKPPQPSLGLSAAFGSGIDWKTSDGEDRYRRGLYTTWRRSNPYPSMAAFDAPNREVCTVRRDRTNTPLQALVTLNDPVYIEAAQALARRCVSHQGDVQDRVRHAFQLCLSRPPEPRELASLVALHATALERFRQDAEQARRMATEPLGPADEGADLADLAAWTVVGNVLLNLDEMFMKR